MDINLEIDMEVFNRAYVDILDSYKYRNDYRYISLLGGAGSGKSVGITQRTILRVLYEEGHRILVVRKVASTIRNSVFRLFLDILDEWGLTRFFKISNSYMTITAPNGSEIIFVGLDDPEKIKSIAGITSIWVEEATELTQNDFNQLDLRVRGNLGVHKEVILTFNPISETHWIKKRFYDNPAHDVIALKTTYLDNAFLDDKYVEVLQSLEHTDPVYYRVYCLGEWGSTGDLVWSNYRIENIPLDDSYYDSVFCGLDFGFNDPSALVKIGMKDGEVYILEEFYQKGLTNTELISKLQGYKQYRIIADSAEPDRIKEFYQKGFNIKGAVKGKNSVKKGIDYIRGVKLHIHPNCTNTITEISNYNYEKDKEGNPTENPIGVNDHLMSALRYGTEPLHRQDKLTFLK